MSGAAQEDLSRIIGVRHVMGTGKYLVLPSMIGRDKRSVFFLSRIVSGNEQMHRGDEYYQRQARKL